MICYCGHDCGRCYVYLATMEPDPEKAAEYRRLAMDFYRDEMGLDLSPETLICRGGHSDTVMAVCGDCPFRRCCREKRIERCADCDGYPCGTLAAYAKRWVNRGGQIKE